MLFTVILVEVLAVAGIAVAVLLDEKKLVAEFERWLSKKPKQLVYRIPLRLVVREQTRVAVEEVKHVARHRYVHS